MTDPTDPIEPIDPVDPADPTEPADPAEPAPPPPSGIDLGRACWRRPAPTPAGAVAGPPTARPCGPATSTGSGAAGRGRTTATRSRSGAAVDRLVAERGWQAQAAVGGVVGRWPDVVGPELADHCAPEGYAETRADGACRLDRLGHPGAAARAQPGRAAQRRVRRGHGDPGPGARARPPVLAQGARCACPGAAPGTRTADRPWLSGRPGYVGGHGPPPERPPRSPTGALMGRF